MRSVWPVSEAVPYFQPQQIEDLQVGLEEAHQQSNELRDRLVEYQFANSTAEEHARHGLVRRLGTMVRCLDQVFDILPPTRDDIPHREELNDVTINIQAFLFNAFGCRENMAWIWVSEKNVRHHNGSRLGRKSIGLGPEYKDVWSSFTPNFREYLESRATWFSNLKKFRDSLAHRIPLYIPPYTVPTEQAGEYTRLNGDATTALIERDIAEYERLTQRAKDLTRFHPIMTQSMFEGPDIVLFHPQMLADFATIHEMAVNLLTELQT